MPRSQNRRQIEIPVELYEELKGEAEQEGVPIAEILRRLVVDGKSMREYYTTLAGRVSDVERELRQLRTAFENRLPPPAFLP